MRRCDRRWGANFSQDLITKMLQIRENFNLKQGLERFEIQVRFRSNKSQKFNWFSNMQINRFAQNPRLKRINIEIKMKFEIQKADLEVVG